MCSVRIPEESEGGDGASAGSDGLFSMACESG